MIANLKAKNLISKINYAIKKNKKVLVITFFKRYKNVLDCLWKDGFIYGYSYSNKYFSIFLKHTKSKLKTANLSSCKKNNFKCYDLILQNLKEKHTIILLKTNLGFISNKVSIKKGLGGQIISRL